MSNTMESKDIGQLMAEADELIRRIHSDSLKDMKETHRLRFQKHAQHFEKIKSEVQGKSRKKEMSGIGSGAEGVHAAILDIVKAMHEFTSGK